MPTNLRYSGNTDRPQNFPFATIDPEESRVLVPDERYDWLCEKYNPKSRVPAHLTIYDIAGLTRGASTGAGLGNAFLSHIRAVDSIFQVVRCFDDAEIILNIFLICELPFHDDKRP